MAVNVEGASPPVFEEIFRNARFAQGGNALFEGKVRGNPKPQVIWTRKGLQMKGSEKHQMIYDEESGKVSLLIKAIGPGDEGEYTCTALNPYGEAICTVYISPEATKAVKKSRSGQKLHKSSSNKQMVQQQQTQQQVQQQQQQQYHQQQFKMQSQNVQQFHQQEVLLPQQPMLVQPQQNLMQQQHHSMVQQQQQHKVMQHHSSSSSFQQSASYSSHQAQMSSSSSTQQFSSSQQQQHHQMSSSSMQQQSGSFNQFGGVQQQQTIPENEPEVIYLKHVERSQPHKKPTEMEQKFGAPAFVTPIRDLTVNEGDKIHFDAKISPVGDPSLSVEWFFNGKPIPASSRMNSTCQFGFVSLDMLNSTTSDCGEYTCVIKNEAGSVHCSAKLLVRARKEFESEFRSATQQMEQKISSSTVVQEIREPPPPVPEFVKPLDGVGEKVEGSNVHLEAQINPVSDHTMKIEWFKDGKPITASSRIGTIFNFGYVSLNISGVRAEDAGTYTCRATNISGEAVTNSTLQVKVTQDLTSSTGISEQQQYIEKVQKLEEYQSSKSLQRMESVIEPQSAPEFKTQLKDQVDIREGGFAHFEARLEPMGDHTMRVEWMKDGHPVEASSRITSFFNFGYVALTIKQVTALDAGRYVCIAYNAKGRVETAANLSTSSKVDPDFQSKSWSSIQQLETSKTSPSASISQPETTSPPQFVSQLKGTNIILEGQRAHFECRIEPQNDPNLKVEWLHNGRALSASSRIQTFCDFGFVAIDILDVKKEDAGVYSLIVKNVLGELRTDVELRVDVHADAVDHSTIHARTVEETKKFEMRQQKTTIQQGTELLCTSAPIFRTPLQNPQPVLEGQNIHLEARLEPIGDPTMKVEWFFNDRSLTVGSRFKTYNDFGFIALDIIGVNAQDAGVYTCRAVNQLGSANTSANVQVHIKSNIITETENEASLQQISYLEASERYQQRVVEDNEPKQPPNFVKSLHNVEIVEGKNVHLEARLLPTGDSTMQVEWTVNGKPLKAGHKIRPAYDFDYVALDLLSVYPEDSGMYTCTARNAYGEAQTTATVKVSRGQQIISESSNELSQFEMLEQRRMTSKLQMEDEVTTQAPVFTTSMKSIEIKEGQRAHFECRIIPVSDPSLQIQWLLNNKPIKQASRIKEGLDFGFVSLDIMQAHPDDAGTYTCRAINKLGEAVNSASLVVKAKETIIKDTLHEAAMTQIHHLEHAHVAQTQEEGLTTQTPSFTSVMKDLVLLEGTSAHFEAKLVPIGDPKLRVDWLHNGKPIQASNRMSTLHDFGFVALDLKYTRPEDSGTYTCRAVNALGETTTSATMQIISAQSGPMGETMHEDALHKIASLEQKKHVSHIMEDDSVQSSPVFVVPLQGKNDLIEGQNIHMECRIEPYPDPSLKVEWFHNGKSLPFGNRWKTSYDFGFAALDILGCYPEDSGTYTLRATNALGMTESHLDIKVSSRSGLLLDSEHADALEKIRYLESKRRRTDDEEIIITEAPQFGHVLKDLNLEEGQPAHFETTLTPVNDANMKVEWYCNGKPIPQGHRFRTTYDFGFVALDILYAYPEDNGNYTCIAKNAIGEDSISCNLSVQGKASLLLDTMDRDRLTHLRNLEHKPDYRPVEGEVQYTKPVFTTPLNNADGVPEQAHVHLECRLEPVNDPNLRVEWFVGGKAIRTGHRFRMTHDFGYVALDILYAYPEDSGTYMCKASNKLGEAVNTCSVSVVGKQSLLLDSQHAESWQKIQHLESRGHQTKLQVIETPSGPPRFVTELMGKTTLLEGQNAHFEAQVEPVHDPSLKIEFIHNGKPLKQASRIHTLCDFGYVALDIAQLIVEDAGEYICRIYNSHGEVRSKINLNITGRDSLDVSSQRPEGLEKIKELERQKQRENREELVTFQKPVFTQSLLNVEKEESQNAHIEARLIPIGDPSLHVEWFKDGKKISTGSRINTLHDFGFVSLDITGLRESDEGVYECRAVNSLGEATTSASIKVASKGSLILDSQHPEGMRKITALETSKLKHQISEQEAKFERPTFVSTLTGTPEVLEGQRAHMECRVVPLGDPNLKFTWFKNGEHLKTGSRIQATQDFGFVTLDIDSCIPEDSGMYTIRAENFAGEASTSFALRIGDKSGIMGDALQPDSLKRIEQLEAQRNQKKKSVEEAAIAQPPVFMTPLKDIGSIPEAQNVHVEASIEPKNDPDLRVEWEFNGQSLSCGSRIKTTLDFGHVQLYINGVRGSDSGLYTCKAINKLGEAVSTTQIKVEETNASDHATVDVKDPPKFVTQITEKISISEGQSAHFEAKLSPAEDPNLIVEWFKDGKPLPTGHRFRTFHDFGIVILDILYTYEDDQGVYECRAKNNFGSDVTKGTIECSAKSNLILTPQIPGEMRESTMEHISHLESSMKCQHRSSSKSIVGSAPRFTVPIHNIDDLKEAESAHFEARVSPTDDPNLIIEWFWNGKALKAGSRIRTFCDFGFVILEISPVYPEDSGEYTCKARNTLGEAVTTATLKCSGKRNLIMDSQLPKGMEGAIDKIAHLEGLGKTRDAPVISDDLGNPPEFLVNLQDLLLAENSLAHFETRITPVNDPSMRVEWYHNGKQLSAGSRIKTINDFGFVILEVANVLTRDSGNYTCKATNKHGESSVSCNVTVKSKQSIITDPQLPRTFRSGTESIQKLEERRWKRGEGPLLEEAPGHPPKFVTQIKDVTLIEGQAAHFDCRVEPVGDGSMKIEWFHEDNPICIGSRIHTLSDFGFIVLDIDWTFKRDSGTYICRASNKFGVAESRANLQVKSMKDINLDSQLPPGMSMDRLKELEKGKVQSRVEEETEITAPKFITQLESRAVGEGEPAHFNCRVEPKHDPKLEVKWYFNGKELSSGHRFRITHEFGYVALDILYAYPEDEGEYVCKATNALGEDITKCTLKCKQLPAIQLEQQAPKGMKKSDYFVQMEASMQKYSQEMRLTEEDVYDAEKRQPPRFVTLIKSITDLMEMQAAKFECQLAPVGDPNMKVEWFFNGKPLPFKNRFTPIYDFGYVAMNFGWVYPEDSGEYVCKATNLYGMDETRAIIKTSGKPGIIFESQLPKGMESIERIREMESGWQRAPELIESETEKFKPCFVTKPEPQEVQEGDWARFCCRVTGYPKPRVMWLLNGHTVINGSKHKLVYDGMWHFDIPKCRDIDAGKVEVIARNQCGEAYALTNLTVKPRADDFRGVLKHNVKRDYVNSKEYRKPEWVTRMEEIQKRLSEQKQSAKFTQEIKEVRIKEGMKAKFEATFAGNPKPEITWYFNNEVLKNSKNTQIKIKEIKTTLTLIDCTAEMAGFYTCKARNPLGGDSTRAGLTVNKLAGGQAVPTPVSVSLKTSISSLDSEEKLAQKQKKKEEKKQKLEEVKAKAQKELQAEKTTPNWKKTAKTPTPKAVPEKKEEEKINFSKIQLKKSAPVDKPAQAPKPEPVQLKPTPPKASKPEESKPQKVELKPVPKKPAAEEISEPEKKKAPSKAPKDSKASEISTEIKESIDAEVKTASSTEIKSELVVHDSSSKSSTTKVTTIQSGEAVQISSSVTDVTKLSIKEGDVFFALATFVSDTGEAMNLVEGEKVHVLEWNNNDWWYVRKHITEESGWVPAQYLKDEQTYTRYVHKKLVEKIEKLPVFEQPKAGESTFAPKIITKVKAMSAIDGCQVEFTCQIEGSPRPQITWFRQTAIIKPSQDFQISYADDNVATLVIKEVFPEDAGTFTCVAKNCVGYASSSADLMVERPLSDHGGVDKHDRRSLSRESSLADIVEGIPPTFAQRPQTKNVEEGSNTELECRFVAIPEAEVRWFHNKVELKDSERLSIHHQADMHMYCSILRISNTHTHDSGTYEVLAKNREGEASNTLILNVSPKTVSQQPPMIVKPLTPTICKIGDSIKMEAVITGKPKPSISWSFNQSPLNTTSDANIKLTDKENIYALSITNVTQAHDGDYRIKVENEFGSAQTQANLCVQGQEISFIKPLEDVEIKECTSYEMSVEVSDENATLIWQKDGQEIKSDDPQYKFKSEGRKRSLIINSSTVHHEGEYVASVGDQECSCELTVIELPPELVKSLSPCKLTSGETGVFEIELSKGDAVTRWFRQGIEIEFNQRIQLIIDGKKQRLEISNADKKDAGEYSVTVGDKSCSALLIVEEPKVSFVGKLKKVTTGTMGQSVKLTVKLSKSDAKIKWLKDGQEISEGPHYSFQIDGDVRTLIIKDAVLSDVASYTCMAENVTTVTDVELTGGDQKLVIVNEEISKQQEMISTRGQDITLNIPFEETSLKPSVKWLFQGQEIQQSDKILMKVTRKLVSITIKHAQSVDCGVYTAKLSNSVSEISIDFVVRIKDKPTPPRGPAMVDWKSDDFMELNWNVPESDGGSAILEYIVERKEESKKSWRQVGISTNTKMEIRGLGKSMSYNFRIFARNEVGLSEAFIVEETFSAASSTLAGSKKSLPGSPSVQVTDVTSKSVTLQWSPPLHNGGAELIEYVLEKKISTSHSWERAATVDPSVTLFTIENLKEKCQYYFRISAVNEVGAGEPTSTEIVSLRTHARPPSTPTAPLEIHSVGPTAIIVEWGAPESDGGAPLEGYKVAVRDAKRHMWMEVGRVKADTQKLKVQDLAEGHQYFIRIFAKNEVGFSDPLENEEAVKVIRPADYKEEEPEEKDKMDDTPSLSFSTTETLSSWMREAHMDADIQSYTTSSSLRRDEYFFRIWYYAKKLFK